MIAGISHHSQRVRYFGCICYYLLWKTILELWKVAEHCGAPILRLNSNSIFTTYINSRRYKAVGAYEQILK
jgi:hypothetical protein